MAGKTELHPGKTQDASSPLRMSFEEFLEWAGEDTWAEWVNGEVVVMSPASRRHQLLKIFLCSLLNHLADARRMGTVLDAPFLMKTAADLPAREPDVLFVANDHTDRIRNVYLDGPADLVIEIISPDSRGRDRGEKFYEYEQGGVREYWLIDSDRRRAEFYQRGEDGTFRLVEPGNDGIYRSVVMEGLWIDVNWLWQDPLPTVASVLKQWAIV